MILVKGDVEKAPGLNDDQTGETKEPAGFKKIIFSGNEGSFNPILIMPIVALAIVALALVVVIILKKKK